MLAATGKKAEIKSTVKNEMARNKC